MPNPIIGLAVGIFVLLVLFVVFKPDDGLYFRWKRAQILSERALSEDALKHLFMCAQEKNKASVESLAGVLKVSRDQAMSILNNLEKLGLLEIMGNNFQLTPEGREYALRIIRAHRLWERYLAEETGYKAAEWHERADLREHLLTPEDVDNLSAQLGNPLHDPHGDPIPTASGEMVQAEGIPLTLLPVDEVGRIIHIEDEPPAVYAQLVAEGLEVGMDVRLIEFSPQRVRFWAGGDEHLVAPIVAANITVVPIKEREIEPKILGMPLSSLKLGEVGEVLYISPKIRGAERRRLMDLGVLPGTRISAEMRSPSGDPTAYRIRGALIALRKEQAKNIYVMKAAGQKEKSFEADVVTSEEKKS